MCGPSKEERQTHLDRLFDMKQHFDVPAQQQAAFAGGVTPGQVCRTCTKTEPQRVQVSIKEMTALRKANGGKLPDDALCQPDKASELRIIRANKTITPIPTGPAAHGPGGSPTGTGIGKVRVHLQTVAERSASVALADTCGQEIQEKCRTCARFKRIVARVPGGTNASGRTYFVEVLIGGHCTIPAEGIVINGETRYCDKQLRSEDPLELRKSCLTCRYNTSYGQDSMLDHVTPLLGDLTPYEMDAARQNAHPDEVGMAIASARRLRVQVRAPLGPRSKNTNTTWTGMIKFYRLEIAKLHVDDHDRPRAVDLRIFPSGDVFTFNLAEADDSIGLVTLVNSRHAVLQITSPHHRQYGLPDNDRVAYPRGEQLGVCPTCHGEKKLIKGVLVCAYDNFRNGVWEAVPCDHCGQTGLVSEALPPQHLFTHDYSDRVDPDCTQCSTRLPCRHHRRSPYLEEEVGVLRLPDGRTEATFSTSLSYRYDDVRVVTPVENVARHVHLRWRDGHVDFIDGNGETPSFTLLRLRIRDILGRCRTATERAEVLRAYVRSKDHVPHAQARRVDFSLLAPARVDAFHNFCSLNAYDQSRRPGKISRPLVRTFDDYGEMKLVSLARGLDFMHEWNDQFGTPRSDMSTNVVMDTYGLGLQRDPMFSWVKWQINEEWLRVTNPGEVVQDEFLASEHQLAQGRKGFGTKETTPMPAETHVTRLGVGISNTSITLDSTQAVVDWLDERMWMPGNDEAAGFGTTRRWMVYGVENFRNTKRLHEDDIPSVFEYNHHIPMNDESTAEQENPGFFACTRCYDPSDAEGSAGKYLPDEVNTVDLSCPDPDCDGVLVFMSTRNEWMQGHMRFTSDQIEPEEPYRRHSGSPDTTAWLQQERLMSMSCPFWAPRQQRG